MKKWLVLTIFAFLIPSFLLHAGGPWKVDVDNTGTAARWPYSRSRGKHVIRWKVDPGHMTDGVIRITSEDAVRDWIQPMLDEWQGVKLPYAADADPVPTAAIEFVYQGSLPSDVNVTNYECYLDPASVCQRGSLRSVVIFDVDGSILLDMCLKENCGLSPSEVCRDQCTADAGSLAGRAEPLLNSAGERIQGGYIILNGAMINNDPARTAQIKAVIKHEFGHLINLAHAVVNTEAALACRRDECEGNEGISTMFPSMLTSAQYTLHVDDKVGISWLYPTEDFNSRFCWIEGDVQDENGDGLQGVNVIASAVNDPLIDSRSFQSGGLYAHGTKNGRYILAGLMPGVEYEVRYEEFPLAADAELSAGYDPCGNDCPSGFGSGVIAGPDDAATVHCGEGGEVITMQSLQLSLGEGRALSGAASQAGPGEEVEKKGKGWCQLMENGNSKMENGSFGPFVFLFSFGLILLALRLKLGRAR